MTALTLVHGDAPEYINVSSSLFGDIRVRPQDVIEFPAGLLGFPECRHFALIGGQASGTFWLQSIEHPVLVFLLVDPFLAYGGYTVDIAPQDLAGLEIAQPSDVAILSIVTLSRSPNEPATANLQGPLAINLRTRIGKQIAIDVPGFGVRVPLDLKQFAATA